VDLFFMFKNCACSDLVCFTSADKDLLRPLIPRRMTRLQRLTLPARALSAANRVILSRKQPI